MRSFRVVVLSPLLDQDSSFFEAVKDFAVEEFISEFSIEGFDIVKAIVKGEHPPELTANALLYKNELPKSWEEQKRVLNFS